MEHTTFDLGGNQFQLLPQKAVLWKEKKSLIISDFHLGKASHFRKSGIPVPFNVFYKNIELFIKLLQWHKPKEVIFLGDLFHSHQNREWQYFSNVLSQFAAIHFILIRGNHDVMDRADFESAGIVVLDEIEEDPFILSHEPLLQLTEGQINICGHIHPGVVLKGKANQGLRLPCFYFDGSKFLLPAFGEFTGTFKMKPAKSDIIYGVIENKVLRIN